MATLTIAKQSRRIARTLGFVPTIIIFFGCAGSKPPESAPTYYPAGLSANSSLTGVYADHWAAPKVTFKILIPSNAQKMNVGINISKDIFHNRDQGISVQFYGRKPESKHRLPVGAQTVAFNVPAQDRGKSLVVRVISDVSFSPSERGMNGDTRRLAYFFENLSFK